MLNVLKLRIRMDFPNLIVNTLIYSGGHGLYFPTIDKELVETLVEAGEDTGLIL